LNETARHADIVLPGSLHEEDEGTVTSAEGRVIKINQAVDCPGDARQDWRIIQDIARQLGRERGFTFAGPREIFDELRQVSRGGLADYSGITWEKIEQQMGVFWPCYSEDHPGTPRLFEPGSWNSVAQGRGPFFFPDGKARFNVATYRPPAEDVDDEYPVILTTGRVITQFLSGTQTRRIGPLLDQYPEPKVEMHPKLAASIGVADGVVHYVLVARSSAGAENVSFEGMRCDRGEVRIYAVGRDGGWFGKPGEWRAIQPRSVQRWHNALFREYFCPQREAIVSAREGVEALRRGGHPLTKGLGEDVPRGSGAR
jgi:predicted molibdopterin-dependent oxidoreductase YjgC